MVVLRPSSNPDDEQVFTLAPRASRQVEKKSQGEVSARVVDKSGVSEVSRTEIADALRGANAELDKPKSAASAAPDEGEKRVDFDKSIPLKEPMLFDEAVQRLCAYFKCTPTTLFAGYTNMARYGEQTAKVEFTESVNSSAPSIHMAGFDNLGKRIWGSHMRRYDGQPMVTVG